MTSDFGGEIIIKTWQSKCVSLKNSNHVSIKITPTYTGEMTFGVGTASSITGDIQWQGITPNIKTTLSYPNKALFVKVVANLGATLTNIEYDYND